MPMKNFRKTPFEQRMHDSWMAKWFKVFYQKGIISYLGARISEMTSWIQLNIICIKPAQ